MVNHTMHGHRLFKPNLWRGSARVAIGGAAAIFFGASFAFGTGFAHAAELAQIGQHRGAAAAPATAQTPAPIPAATGNLRFEGQRVVETDPGAVAA
ncbi:MAG: hypothetical protein ACREH9_10605, partial [Pseudomonadota bacterium]